MSDRFDLERAPADARRHRTWSALEKIAAYAILGAVALLSTWLIDRHVDRVARLGDAQVQVSQ